ncbi:MAG: APC family permease [Syntrophobacterales bacterium]|nr:APC family permease [Syntrophobacterales bacterium]
MYLKPILLIVINLALVGVFVVLLRKPGRLSYYQNGRWWLTWLSVAVITLMDELTSVFYAPAEAYRFIGLSAIVFIAFTAVFVHYMTTRLVEIAEILEHHNLIGGGVYSFSYLVLGPLVSFVAVASIMVDYILTACISAVSAVLNATSFFHLPHHVIITLVLITIWAIAGLNILGIKENARVTFTIFIAAALIFATLIISGILALDSFSIGRLKEAASKTASDLHPGSFFETYHIFIAHIAFCILAYSGVESVLQTAGLVRSWKEIKKAYIFLACTVGLVTPLIAALALSANIDFHLHEGDLITHYATILNGLPFGVMVAILASFTLIMAVNTAFVASSELIERVAHRYGFHWIIVTNRRQSLYRIHLANAAFFSIIIVITSGRQETLADMYALGLLASFCINMGALIIYRYYMGTKELIHFHTSRLVTLIMWIIFVSCFIFLAIMKPHGTLLWGVVTGLVLVAGFLVAQKRAPEIKEIGKGDNEMELILYLAESSAPDIHLVFKRSQETGEEPPEDNVAYITFYSPRAGIPTKLAPNHFRLPLLQLSLYHRLVALLRVVEYEFGDRQVNVHLGWPLSSWLDRLSIGVMIFNMMRLPRLFPHFRFIMSYTEPTGAATRVQAAAVK